MTKQQANKSGKLPGSYKIYHAEWPDNAVEQLKERCEVQVNSVGGGLDIARSHGQIVDGVPTPAIIMVTLPAELMNEEGKPLDPARIFLPDVLHFYEVHGQQVPVPEDQGLLTEQGE